MPKLLSENMWAYVDKNGPIPAHRPDLGSCWLWTRCLSRAGYGQIRLHGATQYTHRWAYTQLVGPIPEGLELDHLCRNFACMNPSHLEAVTHKENMVRAQQKIVCCRGHTYDQANTWMSRYGHRQCKACNRERHLRYYREGRYPRRSRAQARRVEGVTPWS